MLYNLKREMEKRGMSLSAYASALGIRETDAAAYVSGSGDMPMRLIKKTRELFPGCTLAYLFSGGSDGEDPAEFIQKG